MPSTLRAQSPHHPGRPPSLLGIPQGGHPGRPPSLLAIHQGGHPARMAALREATQPACHPPGRPPAHLILCGRSLLLLHSLARLRPLLLRSLLQLCQLVLQVVKRRC